MAATDFTSAGRAVALVAPAAVASGAAINGTFFDSKGWRWLHAFVSTGNVATGTDGTVKMQESDSSGSGYVDIPGAVFTITASGFAATYHGVLDLEQRKRYIKVVGTAGTTGSTDVQVTGVLYGCVNTAEYIDATAGGVDELEFTVLT